jgi:hypothetical protein
MQMAGSRCRSARAAWLAIGVWSAVAVQGGAASDDYAVRTTPAGRSYETELLRVVRDWQRELCDVQGLPAPQSHGPVEIELGLAPPEAPIDHALLRGRRGFFGLVRIPNPEMIDAEALRFALTAVIVRTGIHNLSTNPAAVTEPPAWFVHGLARHADRSRRGVDFEAAYALWSCARLPGAGELWRARESPAAGHPEVAAQLAAFCAGREQRRERWQAWCRHLGNGGAWEPAALARIWTDEADPAVLDAAWDGWMLARTRRIFDPGQTPDGAVRRFRSLLLLYPWDCDNYCPVVARAGIPLAWCIVNPDGDGLRRAAAAKARQMALQGAGRDPAFQAMTSAYAGVLQRMAAGAPARELAPAWRGAEALRAAIEAGVAGQDTPPVRGR